MKLKDRNEKALRCLMTQRWEEAQRLFFENVQEFPSHKTYNNLGNYLIDEGYVCENGKIKNAQELGLMYLLKAAEMEEDPVNLCTIAKAYDYELRTADESQRDSLYIQSYRYLEQAIRIEESNEIQYNYIRICCLLNMDDETILESARKLIEHYICNESISLYLEILRRHFKIEEGVLCIEKYREYLTEMDILMFYTTFELYEEGYQLCENVFAEFSSDQYIASAIIECCINTQHFKEAELYASCIRDVEENKQWCNRILKNMDTSDSYRRKLIENCRMLPPFQSVCGYYGCPIHGTKW